LLKGWVETTGAKFMQTIDIFEICDTSYRAKQVSMSQPGRCQGFGKTITQIVVFRATELKSLLSI